VPPDGIAAGGEGVQVETDAVIRLQWWLALTHPRDALTGV
jgi:hypothetical protein